MMILAEASSGRSDLASASPTKDDTAGSAAGATVSIGAEPPSPVAEKEAVRTVTTIFGSVDSTIWIALPASIGRSKVLGPMTLMMSEICITSMSAAARGATFLALAVEAAMIAS